MASFDAIVLGSTVNELVCAAYLAKGGAKVLLLEPRADVGGAAALTPIADGFRAALAPAEVGWIPEKVVRELGLVAHGLDVDAPSNPMVALGRGGQHVTLSTDLDATRNSIAKVSARDAEKWAAFATQMDRLTAFLESLYEASAVELMNPAPSEMLSLVGHGLRLRRMGKVDMVELLRVLPMSLQDLLDDWFESDLLKGALAATGLRNLFQGPKSAGTGFSLLHHAAGRQAGAFGARTYPKMEQGHLVTVLRAALKKLGVEVRTGLRARVRVEGGRATGVTLEGGETLDARAVVTGSDPRRAFLTEMEPWHLPPEFVRAVKHVKLRGVRTLLAFAVDRLPTFEGVRPDELEGPLVVAPSLTALERAFDQAKHGDLSEHPCLEITIPSLHDPSLTPEGKHIVHVAAQWTPYHLRQRPWDAAAKALVRDRVVETLELHAPGFKATVVGEKVLTPVDLEAEYGLTEGHLYGGELTLDQILFMRPVPGWSHHKTPIEGHFMAGNATHPGGGIMGLAGAHGAAAVLRAL